MGLCDNQIATRERGDLVTKIVSAVSESTGVDPLSLPPLEGTADIDALEAFVNGVDDSMSVSFTYQRLRVSVRNDGSVTVGGQTRGE